MKDNKENKSNNEEFNAFIDPVLNSIKNEILYGSKDNPEEPKGFMSAFEDEKNK